jgi:hypothetical protein
MAAHAASADRERLYRLVDQLPEEELRAAERFLEFLVGQGDPLLRLLADAPVDEEPETELERAAVAEARRDLEAGRVSTLEQIKRDLGL